MIEIVERVSRQVVLSEVVGETLQTHAPLGVKMLMTRWGKSISLLAVFIWQNSLHTFFVYKRIALNIFWIIVKSYLTAFTNSTLFQYPFPPPKKKPREIRTVLFLPNK